MADSQVSPKTQELQAKLSIGTGIAILAGIGAGTAIVLMQKRGKTTKRNR